MSAVTNAVYCVTPGKCRVAVSMSSTLTKVLPVQNFMFIDFCIKNSSNDEFPTTSSRKKTKKPQKNPSNKSRMVMMLKVSQKVTCGNYHNEVCEEDDALQ